MKKTAEERFWGKVQKTDGCWLWTGVRVGKNYKTGGGYGTMIIAGKQVYAHRYSWQLHNGPIPDGLYVLHNCPGGDCSTCVNPAHLFLGTQQDNIADRERKARGWNGCGKKRIGIKLTETKVLAMFRDREKKMTPQAIADKYEISYGQASRVLNKKQWAHIWQ